MGVRSELGVWEGLVCSFARKRRVERLRVLTFAWNFVAH